MTSHRFDAVLFDFDGTVADTGAGIFAGLRHAMAEMGLPPEEDDFLRRFIGPPIQAAFSALCGLSAEDSKRAIQLYRAHYGAGGLFELTVYPGIVPLLEALRTNGIRTGVASSKPQHLIQRIAEGIGIAPLFDVLCGAQSDHIRESKAEIIRRAMAELALPSDSRVLMVGDRYFDVDGAREVGIPCAGVLFGYGSAAELRDAGADFLVETAADLQEIVLISDKP